MKNPKETERESSPKPIFFDPTSHRLVFFTVFSVLFLVFAVVWFVLFIFHLHGSELPLISADTAPARVERDVSAMPPDDNEAPVRPIANAPFDAVSDDRANGGLPTNGELAPQPVVPDIEVHAFVPYWSTAGLVETRANIGTVDVLLPEWFTIDPTSGQIGSLPATQRNELHDVWFRNRDRVRLLPVATANFNDGNQRAEWLISPKRRMDLIEAMSSLVQKEAFDGLCLDVSGAGAEDVEAVADLALAAKNRFDRDSKESCLIAAMDDELLKHPKAADLADRLIVLAFREPGPFSAPAPLAAQDWYKERLSTLLSTKSPRTNWSSRLAALA